MKWTYSIKRKLTAAALLFAICLLVLGNNLLERNQISTLKKSFSSMYQDRLLVESYIFDIYMQLDSKKELLNGPNYKSVQGEISQINDCIEEMLVLYESTYLTNKEKTEFAALKKQLAELNLIEQQIALSHSDLVSQSYLSEHSKSTKEAIGHLAALSNIQTAQGELLSQNADKIIKENSLSSQFEIALLVVIGLIIQALIFSSKTLWFNKSLSPSLN